MNYTIIHQKIYEIRDQQIMLDSDLAALYDVETKVLKQAVKRNLFRFPPDFIFELTREEYSLLRSQFVTLEESGKGKHSKYLPYAFTEQGIAMLSSILHSRKAIEINIEIVRTFVYVRKYALTHRDLAEKLEALEKDYNGKFDDLEEIKSGFRRGEIFLFSSSISIPPFNLFDSAGSKYRTLF